MPLDKNNLNLLKQKHPEPSSSTEEVLLPDKPETAHEIKYENINAESVRKATLKNRGVSGPSGMDADGWRKVLTSKQFGDSSTDLCKTLANVIKKLCIEKDPSNTLEAFLSCRLIPLDKNPVLRPIGVGEVLRIIAWKVIVSALRDDIITSVDPL